MTFEEYISPELLVMIPALYVIGSSLKRFDNFKDKHIPLVLGVVSIMIAFVYECSILGLSFEALYTAIIQGLLCAGATVYGNQLVKQMTKDE